MNEACQTTLNPEVYVSNLMLLAGASKETAAKHGISVTKVSVYNAEADTTVE